MAFDGNEGKLIDNEIAGNWTRAYREANPEGLQGHFFGRKVLESLLAQPDCKGIRFYYGLENGSQQLLAVGADHDQNDIMPGKCNVADESKGCPPECSTPNVLNS